MKVHVNRYEGPLDLLLHLINSSEVDIYDIPIAEITGQYLSYLNLMAALDLDIASDFLVMAANLLYLKSRMMLPDEYDAGAGEERADMRAALVEQLLEYQKFKSAATQLEDQERESAHVLARPPAQMALNYPEDQVWRDVSLFDLLKTFSRIIQYIDDESYLYQIEPEQVNIADRIQELNKLFQESARMSLDDLFYQNMRKYEMIVTFLAILEMIKSGLLVARQEGTFGVIHLFREERTGTEGPKPPEVNPPPKNDTIVTPGEQV